jgi:hypothetical protein
MLPDDVLLEIFGFCVDQGQDSEEETKSWQLLIHVSRRWRTIVFGSPRRLNLRLFCTPQRPASDALDIWPALPFHIQGSISSMSDVVNAITMLNYSNRMRIINFKISGSQFGYVSAAMQKPFPELTYLLLDTSAGYYNITEPVSPELFLSAPRLRVLSLSGVPFPGLPRLLLSATHLVSLHLNEFPHYGGFSLEAMATALPALTRLETFWLEVRYSQYRAFSDADGRRPPPFTRSVLPALTRFTFRGNGEDLKIFVAQFDTPLLNRLSVTFFDPDHIHMYTTQLAQFIGHAPRFSANDEANIIFSDRTVTVKLASRAIGFEGPVVSIQYTGSVSSLDHICTPSFPPLSTLERLYIYEIGHLGAERRWNIEKIEWLEIWRRFTAVKNLYISKLLAPTIVSKLQGLVGRGMVEVLPILQNIFVEGLQQPRPLQELFVAARQPSGHPLNVSLWNRLKDLEQDNFRGDDDFK